MDVRSAVKEKENYADIVLWFRAQGDLDSERLVLLADTVGDMSEEIFEHYKALCDLLKDQLRRIRRMGEETGYEAAFPEKTVRRRIAYAAEKACGLRAVLPEKYEDMVKALYR